MATIKAFTAAGEAGADIAFDDGGHKEILNPPVVLGHEFSGMVCKVGKNVTKWKVGDRVMSDNTGEVCGETQWLEPGENAINIALTGSGEVTYNVYVNGSFYTTFTMNFN